MPSIHVIEHDGRTAALVVAGHAIVCEQLSGEDRQAVQAKCLYALQIDAGERPGPYEGSAAERYAHDTIATRPRREPRRAGTEGRRRGGRRLYDA